MVYLLDGAPYGAPDSLFSGDLLFLGGSGEQELELQGESTHRLAFRIMEEKLLPFQ